MSAVDPVPRRDASAPLGRPGGLRELVPGVHGATTADGADVLLVERPGAPDEAERVAAARVASRPAIADALTLAVARRWADPAAGRPMPPVLLSATRAMAGLSVVLVLLDLAAGTPVALGPLLALAAALALGAGGLAALGRLGIAGATVDEGVRVVGGPIVDVARAAAAGDAVALARLEHLRAVWWTGPVDDPDEHAGRDPDPDAAAPAALAPDAAAPGGAAPDAAGPGAADPAIAAADPADSDAAPAGRDPDAARRAHPARDEPWTVRAPDDARLWATNAVGDAVYAPGVLGVRDGAGVETLVVAPPDGARGWRRLLVLQLTGATRRLEADDRGTLWFAVAPTEGPGARAAFVAGNALAVVATIALGIAAWASADTAPLAWAVGAMLAFSVVTGVGGLWLIDRVARRSCRELTDPPPDLRRRCDALREALDAEGPDGPAVVAGRRLLWDALGGHRAPADRSARR